MFGYTARHLKIKVAQEASQNACNPVHQSFEIDGWYADLGKELAGCSTQVGPPGSTRARLHRHHREPPQRKRETRLSVGGKYHDADARRIDHHRQHQRLAVAEATPGRRAV